MQQQKDELIFEAKREVLLTFLIQFSLPLTGSEQILLPKGEKIKVVAENYMRGGEYIYAEPFRYKFFEQHIHQSLKKEKEFYREQYESYLYI